MASGERELFFFGDVIPGKLSVSVQAVLMELVGGGGGREEGGGNQRLEALVSSMSKKMEIG